MEHEELERIVNEYCDGMRETLLKNLKHFEADWDGCHVRALGAMIAHNPTARVKRAASAICRSMTYYKLSL